MKKTLAILMALSMMLSCVVGFSVSSAAEEEYVEETYEYKMAILDDYGKVDDMDQNPETGSYDSVDGFYLGDVWTYEYYNTETEEFLPMTGYFKSAQDGHTPKEGNIYVPYAEAGYGASNGPLVYCMIRSKGLGMHPGIGAGPVVSFIVPASGTISYDVALRNNSTDGNYATLWLNDTMIWPKNGDMDSAIFNATNSGEPDMFEISCPSFKVEEGDLVRLVITCVGGNRSSKHTSLVEPPVVTYHEASVSIGNPDGTPPKNVAANRVSKDTTDTYVTWEEARGAVGYNVYVKASASDSEPVKVNDAPISELEYTITSDLDFDTLYEVTVTSVTAEGKESVPGDPAGFKTPKGEGKTSDKDSDKNSDTSNTDVATNNGGNQQGTSNNTGDTSNGFPWIIVVIVVGAVVVVAVVLVLVLGKKKKAPAVEASTKAAVEAPVEAAPVEEAPAEEPAEEEKKDEE